MNNEKLLMSLEKLLCELNYADNIVEVSTQKYLIGLKKLVLKYLQETRKGKLKITNEGTLGFRRAVIEYDDLANINTLYNAAKSVDMCYLELCKNKLM